MKVPQKVAIKILRLDQNVYAREEIEILKDVRLKQAMSGIDAKCIRLLNAFTYKGHYCMVFPVYPMCLKTFLDLQENERGLPMKYIKKITYDLLTGVEFLHSNHIVHTDIKLENILVRNAEVGDITLIDFGSALYEHDEHEEIITTSHYRAPEVILGIGWSYPVDLWAIGCIMFELLSGDLMFNPKNKAEHLGTIEHYLGAIPPHIALKIKGKERKYFDSNGRLMWPEIASKKSHERYVESLDSIETEILLAEKYNNATKTESGLFYDLLLKLITIDPEKRITANEALRHQFLAGEKENDEARRRSQMKDKLIRASELSPSADLKKKLDRTKEDNLENKSRSSIELGAKPFLSLDSPNIATDKVISNDQGIVKDPVLSLGLSNRVSKSIKLEDQDERNKILDSNVLEESNTISPLLPRIENEDIQSENDVKVQQDGSIDINWESEDESGDIASESTTPSTHFSGRDSSSDLNNSSKSKIRPTPLILEHPDFLSQTSTSSIGTPKSLSIISADREDLEEPVRTKKVKTKHRKPNHRTPALTSVKKESRIQKKKKIAVRRKELIEGTNSLSTINQTYGFGLKRTSYVISNSTTNRNSPIPKPINTIKRPNSSASMGSSNNLKLEKLLSSQSITNDSLKTHTIASKKATSSEINLPLKRFSVVNAKTTTDENNIKRRSVSDLKTQVTEQPSQSNGNISPRILQTKLRTTNISRVSTAPFQQAKPASTTSNINSVSTKLKGTILKSNSSASLKTTNIQESSKSGTLSNKETTTHTHEASKDLVNSLKGTNSTTNAKKIYSSTTNSTQTTLNSRPTTREALKTNKLSQKSSNATQRATNSKLQKDSKISKNLTKTTTFKQSTTQSNSLIKISPLPLEKTIDSTPISRDISSSALTNSPRTKLPTGSSLVDNTTQSRRGSSSSPLPHNISKASSHASPNSITEVSSSGTILKSSKYLNVKPRINSGRSATNENVQFLGNSKPRPMMLKRPQIKRPNLTQK